MWHWETGEPVEDFTQYNYETEDFCDNCDKYRKGTMIHAPGATGRVCPVLFLCPECNWGNKK